MFSKLNKSTATALTILILSAIPALAKTTIKSIYFNSDDSIVLETKGRINFRDYKLNSSESSNSTFVLEFPDTDLKKVAKNISNDKYQITIDDEKRSNGGFFNKESIVKITLESPESNLSFSARPILNNSAYEIRFQAKGLPSRTISELEEVHELKVEENLVTQTVFSNESTHSEAFLDGLDREIVVDTLDTEEFKKKRLEKIDAANLEIMAEALVDAGHIKEGVDAFRKAVEINPDNTNARLGLAKYTADKKEKLENYIHAVKTDSLVYIGETWLEAGIKKNNPKIIAAALVSLQYSVLKEPMNPDLRMKYAQALEKSGQDYYPQASKRYLETAAIAKKDFQNGNKKVEPLLRNSMESLIRLMSIQGNFKDASKYLESYLALGYNHFLGGDSTKGIYKKIRANKNPFRINH